MSHAVHRIRRLTWLVRARSSAEAQTLRPTLRNQVDSVLLPALERVLDGMAPADRVVRIPKLSLHVSAAVTDHEELTRQIEEQLRSLLSEALRDGIRSSAEGGLAAANQRREASLVDVANHRRGGLVDYLRAGRLPWSADHDDATSVVDWLRDAAESLASDVATLRSHLPATLATRVAFLFRLLQLLRPESRAELSARLGGNAAGHAVRSRTTESGRGAEFNALATAASALARHAFDRHESNHELPNERPLGSVVAKLRGADNQTGEHGEPAADSADRTFHNPREQSNATDDEPAKNLMRAPRTPRIATTDSDADRRAARQMDDGRDGGESSEAQVVNDVLTSILTASPGTAVSAAQDASGLLARDAGLVLLHPYLPRFFAAVGVCESDGKRLSAESLPRAAALLHWLACGRSEVHEFELTVSKVLLGLSPREPLPVSDGLLDDADRAEADSLMAAAIQHWSVLRGTSIANLRTSFLQRSGMLRSEAGTWRLRMESASFDVLLARLPWGVAIIKLPWMTQPIFTEWPTP